MMERGFAAVFQQVASFLYPPCCLHCNSYGYEGGLLFCPDCCSFFEFLESTRRERAACFVYYEAVATFVKTWKSAKMPYLSKIAAALLFFQMQKLAWEKCDLLIPVPSRHWIKSYDPLYVMTRYLAQLTKIEYGQPMERKRGRRKQASLSREERMTLTADHFIVHDKKRVKGKKILLLDDVITTGSTLRALTSLLYEVGAEEVYGLVFAEAADNFAAPLLPITCTSP